MKTQNTKRRRTHSPFTYHLIKLMLEIASLPEFEEGVQGALTDALFEFGYVTGINMNHPKVLRAAYLAMLDEMCERREDAEAANKRDEAVRRMEGAHATLVATVGGIATRYRSEIEALEWPEVIDTEAHS